MRKAAWYISTLKPGQQCTACHLGDRDQCGWCGTYPTWRFDPTQLERMDELRAQQVASGELVEVPDPDTDPMGFINYRERQNLDPTHNWPGKTLEELRGGVL